MLVLVFPHYLTYVLSPWSQDRVTLAWENTPEGIEKPNGVPRIYS